MKLKYENLRKFKHFISFLTNGIFCCYCFVYLTCLIQSENPGLYNKKGGGKQVIENVGKIPK